MDKDRRKTNPVESSKAFGLDMPWSDGLKTDEGNGDGAEKIDKRVPGKACIKAILPLYCARNGSVFG
jgi:hypothetical protein